MANLKYIGDDSHMSLYRKNSTISELVSWYPTNPEVQFDTETNMTKDLTLRELRVLQFGDLAGENIFVVQWSHLNDNEKEEIRKLLRINTIRKIIHNAKFDYQVALSIDVVLENVWCTMTMEQVLYAGYDYDRSFFSLAETLSRRYGIDVSKEQQGNFSDDIMTDEKLTYAATDVVHIGKLKQDQWNELQKEDLLYLAEGEYSENECLLSFGDMEYYGMGFDPIKWEENIHKAEPVVSDATYKLNQVLLQDEFRYRGYYLDCKTKLTSSSGKERTLATKAILDDDMLTVNWNSSPQVLELLQVVYPDLQKASQLELKKYLAANDPTCTEKPTSKRFEGYLIESVKNPNKFIFIVLAAMKKYDALEAGLKANFRDELLSRKLMLPKDTIMINWNSQPTKLAVFQWFDPNIQDCRAETVEEHKYSHDFFEIYQDYQDANSLVTKYGYKFIEEHMDSDGRIRTDYDPIKSTGRVSSSKPNIQQIPANKLPKGRQNDYRNCFVPGFTDWVIVGCDYASQELAIIGTLSQDPVFLDALRTGKDLHSVCAALVYGEKWKQAADDDCAFYAMDSNGDPKCGKCECSGHKTLRNNVKTINFGLAYGMSAVALSKRVKITMEEAEQLIELYFMTFPKIKGLLTALGYFGTQNGYIQTPAPMRRKRYFPYWKGPDTNSKLMGMIERASKNMPIQGLAADMTKVALIRLRRRINEANMRDHIRLFVQVHDQIDSTCHKSLATQWGEIHKYEMEEAARICLNNTLLKGDLQISELWQK